MEADLTYNSKVSVFQVYLMYKNQVFATKSFTETDICMYKLYYKDTCA